MSEPADKPPLTSGRRWLERGVLGVVMVAMLVFYTWTVMSTTGYEWTLGDPQQGDYYNLLVHGFRDGHLYLKAEVPESLIKAENPYDPNKRPPGGLMHDVSYYQGHYYLYFGVTPVVVLFLPYAVLTGHDLPQHLGNLVFASIGFLAAAGLFLAVRRRYFPATGLAVAVTGMLALGLASLVTGVLRRPSFWELPIASAYCFAMLTLACVYRVLHTRHAAFWMAAAGLCLGLTVGSRPTYVATAPLLAAPLLWFWWEGRSRGAWRWWPDRTWWSRAVAGGAAFGAVVAGLLWYNYARFGKPSEFGLNYQLTGMYEAKVTHFTARFVPFNWHVYYLAPAQWSRYFPFIEVIHEPKRPEGYYGTEFVYGILVCLPLVWMALAAPLGLKRRPADQRGPLGAWLAAVALLYLPMGMIMLFFVTAAARYMVDFTPALMLLACCGMLAIERLPLSSGRRWLARAGWGALAAFSIFFGVMASFQLMELLRLNDAPTQRKLAHFFDQPSQWIEHLTGSPHGPLEMKLRFPTGRTDQYEQLMSTGWEFYSDHIFLHYADSGHVQVGFSHTGYFTEMSEPLSVDYGAVHDLRIEMGSLYPPEAHPFFNGQTPVEVASLSRWLRLTLDGHVLLQGPQVFFDGSPGSVRLGGNGFSEAFGHHFSGQIISVRRGAYRGLREPRTGDGPVRLQVLFPRDPTVQNQPLITTGETGRGDLLYVRFERPGILRFGYDHWGVHEHESGEVPYAKAGELHTIEMRFGSLMTPARTMAQAALRESLVVKLDDEVVWSHRMPYYDVPAQKANIGTNLIGATSCGPVFTGAIVGVDRPEEAPRATGGPWHLQVMFPADRVGRSEPLVGSGSSGAGDVLFVNYLDAQHVRFGFSHDGARATFSAPLGVDYQKIQTLAIQLTAFSPPPNAPEHYPGDLAVVLNGTEIWRQRVEFHHAAPGTFVIGENRTGTDACDAVFAGGIVAIDAGPPP